MRPLQNWRIARKLLLLFMVVAITPLTVAGWISYQRSVALISREVLHHLNGQADFKAWQISRYLKEKRLDAAILARDPLLVRALRGYAAVFADQGVEGAGYRELDGEFKGFFAEYLATLGFHDLLLINRQGDIVFTVAREDDHGTNLATGPWRDTALAAVFAEVRDSGAGAMSAFRPYGPSPGTAYIFFAAPVIVNNEVIGVAALQMGPDELFDFLNDYTALGDSGEIVLATRVGSEALFVKPLRHDPDAAFTRKNIIGSEAGRPIQHAVMGQTSVRSGLYRDYRGIEVIASWQYIPEADWGMVVKIDRREAFASVGEVSRLFILLGLATLLAVAVISRLMSHSLARPILELDRAARRMEAGDLAARAAIATGGEIGSLAGAFNHMAASLEKSLAEVRRQNWLQKGLGLLDDRMRGDLTVMDLAGRVVAGVAEYLGMVVGVLHVNRGEDVFVRAAGYCFSPSDEAPAAFKMGEGLVGQAAVEKRLLVVDGVPAGYLRIVSGLGGAEPKSLAILPLVHNDRVVGVLELGALGPVDGRQREFLDRAAAGIAIALHTALARETLSRALERSRHLTGELQRQQEELRVSNEELVEQARRLQASEEELKGQEEELRAANEEMEAQNAILEKRQRELTGKNEELARTQARLAEKARQLEISGRYKSEFLANMSHELRTPLNSLLLLSQDLAANKTRNLTYDQAKAAQIIHDSGNTLLTLINDILDLSKIEAGKMSVTAAVVAIADTARRLESTFRGLMESKGLQFEVEIAPELPASIRTDSQRLEQILGNLLANAFKFTEQGKVTLRFFRPQPPDDAGSTPLAGVDLLAVSVSDSGIGIPAEIQQEVFEAFRQADGSISRRYGGTGLGLSISRQLAGLLGGELRLQSAAGQGSVFTLYLPLTSGEPRPAAVAPEEIKDDAARDPAGEKGPAAAGEPGQPSEPVVATGEELDRTGGNRAILIIEDDADFAGILKKTCVEHGFDCLHAGSGEEGLATAFRERPAAIILDLNLPGLSGWQVLEGLKTDSATRHIPVHIMSVEEPSSEAFKRGVIGFLSKPVGREELEAVFARIEAMTAGTIRKLLLVEDDEAQRQAVMKLIGNGEVKITAVADGGQALAALGRERFDCLILDLGLPDMTGLELLERARVLPEVAMPPVIVYTAREIGWEEEEKLREHVASIIIKGAERAPGRLLDETALFLHRVVERLPEYKRRMIAALHDTETMFQGRKILLVDDDMRTLFAIGKALEERGCTVLKAANGKKGLEMLANEPDVDLVLMDIMMPVMDGCEAMREIRRSTAPFRNVPILALTAKAMQEDRRQCMASGANDYLTKPVDMDRLLSLLRVWLYQGTGGRG